jgi:hypothetical protein
MNCAYDHDFRSKRYSPERASNMQAPANPFKTALAGPRPLIGVWSMLNSSTAVEVRKRLGVAY